MKNVLLFAAIMTICGSLKMMDKNNPCDMQMVSVYYKNKKEVARFYSGNGGFYLRGFTDPNFTIMGKRFQADSLSVKISK